MSRIETTLKTIGYFDDQKLEGLAAAPKSPKIWPQLVPILDLYSFRNSGFDMEYMNRQRFQLGQLRLNLIHTKDAITFIEKENCRWAITTIDGICEWAAQNGYKSWQQLIGMYEVCGLGLKKCSVEVACKLDDMGLYKAFSDKGRVGFGEYMIKKGYSIATDFPGIAKYFFPSVEIVEIRGSTEVVKDPVIVGVVETGESLRDAGWFRLGSKFKEAVLVNSQTCIVRKRRQNDPAYTNI